MLTIIAVTAFAVLLFVAIFLERLPVLETRFVQWFSDLTTRPRWFVAWCLIFGLWLSLRKLLLEHHVPWYDGDTDTVIMTFLWSVVPFMVENVLKTTTAQTMITLLDLVRTVLAIQRDQSELITALKEALDRSEKRENVMVGALERVLDAVEDRGGEPDGSARCVSCSNRLDEGSQAQAGA